MSDWRREIDELHAFFEGYFLGETSSVARVDAVLGAAFTMVGPDGVVSDRATTMRAIETGHGHTAHLKIRCSQHELIYESSDVIVATYVESHDLADRTNHRRTTVVFGYDPQAPNGLSWLRAHETWLPSDDI